MTQAFDPNAAASKDSGIFGLPFSPEQAALVLLPVPWEATTSYGGGTSEAPSAIFEASHQVDLHDLDVHGIYTHGIAMLDEDADIVAWNVEAREAALRVIDAQGEPTTPALTGDLALVNQLSQRLNERVLELAREQIRAGKLLGLVGGDHSIPFGALQAVAEQHPEFGVLHIDAHSDTRNAYEGFSFSHASIMHNVLTHIPQVNKLVQVGIRDVCEQEMDFCAAQGARVVVHTDRALSRARFAGARWQDTAMSIVAALPAKVWISFDIDGLDPRFCPHTGTPVPGGLDYSEAVHLLMEVVRQGKTIVGFDLNEVAPSTDPMNEWDANVGARLLYKLCGAMFASHGMATLAE